MGRNGIQPEVIEEIRNLRTAGVSLKDIGLRLKIAPSVCSKYTQDLVQRKPGQEPYEVLPEQVIAVRNLKKEKISLKEIADRIGTGYHIVRNITLGHYNHLIENEFFSVESYCKQTATI